MTAPFIYADLTKWVRDVPLDTACHALKPDLQIGVALFCCCWCVPESGVYVVRTRVKEGGGRDDKQDTHMAVQSSPPVAVFMSDIW